MLIENLVDQYGAIAAKASVAVPIDTVLHATAAEILEMVCCYASDSRVFLEKDDPVNAFAAAAYGYGWLDCGGYLGYTTATRCGVPDLDSTIPDRHAAKLEEKTLRYARMLTEALAAVSPAPDAETVSFPAAEKIAAMADEALKTGTSLIAQKAYVAALTVLSYGYGWLDCGVRAGLFRIAGDRHLFTI